MTNDLFELACLALGSHMTPEDLLQLVPRRYWDRGDIPAIISALHNAYDIDWNAYLNRYTDVKESGIDPCEHFMHYGIYEGRKLTRQVTTLPDLSVTNDTDTSNSETSPIKFDSPLVSVIICNYNNAQFLEQCLTSVINQTLFNIEIIVVDDASTDNSVQIINSIMSNDPRVIFIAHESNQSIHMSRKNGAAIAKGEYIMFLDSDDFYAPNACEAAYNTIKEGYDVVAFSSNIVKCGCVDLSAYSSLLSAATITEGRVYYQSELRNVYFGDMTINWQIITKIFKTQIVNIIFSTMPDIPLHYGEDAFFIAVSISYTYKLKTITDKLLNYRFGNGISTSKNPRYFLDTWFSLGDMTRQLELYAKKYFLNLPIQQFKHSQCFSSIWHWHKYCTQDNYKKYFELMVSQYGIECILRTVIYEFATKKEEIANCLRFVIGGRNPNKNIRVIGLLCRQFVRNGFEDLLISMGHTLQEAGYKVIIIAEKFPQESHSLNDGIEFVRVHPTSPAPEEAIRRARNLRQILQDRQIDLLISNDPYSSCNLWDVIVCWHEYVPMLMCWHGNYATNFAPMVCNAFMYEHEAVWRCMASLSCPSKGQVLYLRSQGINASYLPNHINPIKASSSEDRSTVVCVNKFPVDYPKSSILAKDSTIEFSHKYYKCNFVNWIANYNNYSLLLNHDLHEYRQLIKYVSFYAGREEHKFEHDLG